MAELDARYKEALSSGDFSNFSEADKELYIREMQEIGGYWRQIIYALMIYFSYPLGIFNKIVYC